MFTKQDSLFSVRSKFIYLLFPYYISGYTSSFGGFHPISGFNYSQCFNYFQIYITHTEFQSCLFSSFLDLLPLHISLTSQI